jgi:mitochondrial distribution and morphology protein 31
MSANFGHKLQTTISKSASQPFFRDIRTNCKIRPLNSLDSSHLWGGFFRQNYHGKTPPGASRRITRRFASGSFLVLGASSSSAPTVETGATCAISAEKVIRCRGSYPTILQSLTNNVWRRTLHTSQTDRARAEVTRGGDGTPNDGVSTQGIPKNAASQANAKSPDTERSKPKLDSKSTNSTDGLLNRPQFHRPTKEELLAAATGFWSRLRIRFKWFSIRSVRPFNIDEITALFSWVLLGHIIWIIVGTTTFFSLLIFAINTVFAQG